MSTTTARMAEIQYSQDYSRIELVVPQGTKVSQRLDHVIRVDLETGAVVGE